MKKICYRLRETMSASIILSVLVVLVGLSSMSSAFTNIRADFNGDGFDDLAIGVPYEDVGSIPNAGAVNVIYGGPGGLAASNVPNDQIFTQDTLGIWENAEYGDLFGWSLAAGDFNGDGADDLAIGVPYENSFASPAIGMLYAGPGAVNVIYGGSGGLSASNVPNVQFFTQSAPDIEDIPEYGDLFGFSLAAGDFNGDGKDDLAIGVPYESVGSVFYAGAVSVIYGGSGGLSASNVPNDQFFTQETPGIAGAAELGDAFGLSLAAGDFNGDGKDDLAIGVPYEDVAVVTSSEISGSGTILIPSPPEEDAGSITDAGAVNVIYGGLGGLSASNIPNDQFFTQGAPGIEDSPEPGELFGSAIAAADFNRDGRDDLAIGVPHEAVASIADAGAVNVIYGGLGGLSASNIPNDQFFTQGAPDIEDIPEYGDLFGWSLAAGDFNGGGFDDLAIGVPKEDVARIADAGALNVIFGGSGGLSAGKVLNNQFFTQDSRGIEDAAEAGDVFGSAVAAGDFNGDGKDDLAIGVAHEDVGNIADAGAVNIIYGGSGGLSAGNFPNDQFFTQDTPGIAGACEAGDVFGSALSHSSKRVP